jgi:hypothetical protein
MSHIQEDALERYLLHNSPAAEREAIEEHLLVCEECQHSLSEVDIYIKTMKEAFHVTGRDWPGCRSGFYRR